jgi:surface antigen
MVKDGHACTVRMLQTPQKESLLSKRFFAVLFIVASAVSLFVSPSIVSASTLPLQSRHVTISTSSCTRWFVVRSGDWLSRITPNWRAVAAYNGLTNPNRIYPGQRLCLAWGGSSSSPVTYSPVSYTSKGPNRYPWGNCTYGAEELATRDLNGLGNAKDWDNNARSRGIPVGSVPVIGSTVVFDPGVQFANNVYGHVAHVVAIGANGSFQIREMNNSYYGGFGIYNYRWVYTGAGVSFIY